MNNECHFHIFFLNNNAKVHDNCLVQTPQIVCSVIFDLKWPPINLCSPSLPFPTCNSVESHDNKNSDGEPMLDKLRGRLNSWGNNYVSLGGRIALLNSMLNSIPIFYLSCENPKRISLGWIEGREENLLG